MTTDVYTITLKCSTVARCGHQVYTATSSPGAIDGIHQLRPTPTLGGVYDVLITMENAATMADLNIDTTVDDSPTLEVIDTTTVPSFCRVVASDTTGDIVRPNGSTFSYTM